MLYDHGKLMMAWDRSQHVHLRTHDLFGKASTKDGLVLLGRGGGAGSARAEGQESITTLRLGVGIHTRHMYSEKSRQAVYGHS
jgi:hypothetical protein